MNLLRMRSSLVVFVMCFLAQLAYGSAGADIDGSGIVDFNDLVIMQDYWLGPGPVADIGGADGNNGKNGETGENPFTSDKVTSRPTNMTRAAKIVQTDPDRAKRLASAAKAQKFFPGLFPQAS